jgi:antitoxin component of RelBE/YafQ-DinJ toxin-antitoxin module
MSTVKPTIFDGETHRPMTDAEYAQWQADNAAAQIETDAKAAARQAVLDKLGLTSDEAAALFG